MNINHPNIAILKQFNPTKISTSSSIISEGAVFHYFNPMLPDLQGDYHGKQGFVDFFEKISSKTDGTFEVTPRSITPIGDELVITHVKDKMTMNDQKLIVDAVVVWRIVDGKIREAWDIPAVYTAAGNG